MFLNSLYIDGFGPFRDALIGDFKPGFNLVVTKDEQSARALRAFIWSVLFGFGTTGSAENNGTYGGFLGFESDEGPVTVSRYSRMGSVDLSDEGGLVTVTGADRNLEQLVGTANPQALRNIYSIDPADFERFRDVVKFQIAQTVAEIARLAAEEDSAARQAAGFPDRPPSIYEIMEEMRASRSLQIARVDNLQRSVIGVGRRLRSARKREARLDLLTELRPAWNKMLELQRQMAELPRLPSIGDDPLISLDTASSVLSMARARAEAARATEEQRLEEVELTQPTDDELAELAEIESLLDGRSEFNSLVGQTEDTETKLNSARAELESHLSQIEGVWTVERAQKFAAEVRPADIDIHETAMAESETTHAAAEKDLREASIVLGKAEAEVTSADLRLGQLSDVAEDDPKELDSRLDILSRLKGNLLAITTKRAEVASIEVQRTEAARIGSGVSHMLVMVQLGVSTLFGLVGLVVWSWASLENDSMTARTGLVMMGAGIVGMAFGASYLQLQRRPRVKVLLDPDSNSTQSPTTMRGHILKLIKVGPVTVVGAVTKLVQNYKAKRATEAAKKGLTAEDDGKAAPSADTQKSSFSIMGMIARLREMNKTSAEDDEEEPLQTSADGGDEDADEVLADSNEPQKSRSPFGIMELIGKFTFFRKSDESSEDSEYDEDDDLLAKISDEIDEEESDSEDDDDVADAIARAESEVPDELKKARERAEDESKPGLVSGLLARFMPGKNAPEASDEEVLAEMDEDEAEAPGGLASLMGMLISKIRKSDAPDAVAVAEQEDEDEAEDEVAEESAPVAESDDAKPEDATPEDAKEDESEEAETEAESDETAAEESEDGESDEVEASEPVAESEEESDVSSEDATEDAPTSEDAESEQAADADSDDSVAAEAADEPADEAKPESNAIEIEDPLKALDHSVARASLEVEQLEAEVDRLLGVYAVSVDRSKEQFGTVTPETIGYEIARTERTAARRVELEERRTEVDALKQSVTAAQAEVNAKQDKTAETSGSVTHAQEGWQEWLFGVELDPEMSVAQVRRVVDTLEPIRSQVTACEGLEDQVAKLRADVDRVETRIRNLADSNLDEGASAEACYGSLERIAIGTNSRISNVADMTAELRILEKDRAEADAEWSEADFKMQSILDEAGADDETEFRSLVEGAAKRKELTKMLETLRYETPGITGIDAAELKKDLKAINHERTHAELAELPERIDRLHAQLTLLEQDLVDAETELAHLPEIPVDVESSLENGRHAPPPLPSILGRPLSDQIIATSVRFLKMLTSDAYTGIEMVPSEDGLNTIGYKVIDNEGNSIDPREVDSSALFMALRAGAAEVHGEAAGSVPMVLNDFFGALAPADSRIAMGGLAALSANKQVICVTSDARAGARFAVLGNPDQIHLVDATDLESPFKEVAAS